MREHPIEQRALSNYETLRVGDGFLREPREEERRDESLVFNAASNDLVAGPGLPAATTSKTAPDWKPVAGALNGGVPPADAFFDQTATFRGAIGTVDRTAGWTKYPQN